MPEDAGVAVRVWRAPRVSFPRAFYAVGVGFGLLCVIVGSWVLLFDEGGQIAGGITFLVVGVIFVAAGVVCLRYPAHRVEQLGESRFRFVSARRTLELGPGELRSLRCVGPDPNRLLPMWLRTATGGMLIAPRMEGVEDLYRLLATSNPGVPITRPTPIGWWR